MDCLFAFLKHETKFTSIASFGGDYRRGFMTSLVIGLGWGGVICRFRELTRVVQELKNNKRIYVFCNTNMSDMLSFFFFVIGSSLASAEKKTGRGARINREVGKKIMKFK